MAAGEPERLTNIFPLAFNGMAYGQINPDWGCLQANRMTVFFKTDNAV